MTEVLINGEFDNNGETVTEPYQELNKYFLAVMGEILLSPHETAAETTELTHTQGRVLLCLALRGPQRMSDIAKLLLIGLPSATALIDRLVALKLVKRRKDPADRRVVLVELTQNGWSIHKNCDNVRAEVFKKIFSRLDESEKQEVLHSFRRLNELMGRNPKESSR